VYCRPLQKIWLICEPMTMLWRNWQAATRNCFRPNWCSVFSATKASSVSGENFRALPKLLFSMPRTLIGYKLPILRQDGKGTPLRRSRSWLILRTSRSTGGSKARSSLVGTSFNLRYQKIPSSVFVHQPLVSEHGVALTESLTDRLLML
jgi:hypothetical protein